MSEPKKQHYVPQTYLKNFATGKKNNSLYVLSASPRKIYSSQVEDTAAERNFYTVEKLKNKYIWENTYAQHIEPSFGTLLKQIRKYCENALVQNNFTVISQGQKELLSINIVIQMLRGKQARKYQRKLYDKSLPPAFLDAQTHYQNLEEIDIERTFEKFNNDDNYFKDIAMQTVFNKDTIIKISNVLFRYSFIFFRTKGLIPFVTSDNPVMFINSITQNATPFANGLNKNTTIVYFPISPCLLLSAFHPDFGFGNLNCQDCTLEILDDYKEKKFINTYNKKQFEQCYNYIYSNSKKTLQNLFCKVNEVR
jgi:hypothetical protein